MDAIENIGHSDAQIDSDSRFQDLEEKEIEFEQIILENTSDKDEDSFKFPLKLPRSTDWKLRASQCIQGTAPIKKAECVDFQDLHLLLAFTQKHDQEAFRSLLFYNEAYPDRFVSLALIHVTYAYGQDFRETGKGRLYSYCKSHFRNEIRHLGLQTIKRIYRNFLCRNLYWGY